MVGPPSNILVSQKQVRVRLLGLHPSVRKKALDHYSRRDQSFSLLPSNSSLERLSARHPQSEWLAKIRLLSDCLAQSPGSFRPPKEVEIDVEGDEEFPREMGDLE